CVTKARPTPGPCSRPVCRCGCGVTKAPFTAFWPLPISTSAGRHWPRWPPMCSRPGRRPVDRCPAAADNPADAGAPAARLSLNQECSMSLYAMTGGAAGIGAAIKAGLQAAGHEVIVADLRDADIIADLSTAEGRAAAVAGIRARAPQGLDGFVPCAGLAPNV